MSDLERIDRNIKRIAKAAGGFRVPIFLLAVGVIADIKWPALLAATWVLVSHGKDVWRRFTFTMDHKS